MGAKPIGERICMDCDALAVEGSMRCAPCRDKAEIERRASRRERANIRYQKTGPKKRKLSGTCCDCGKAVRAESVRCLPCSLVFVGQRRAQRLAESAAEKAERVAQVKRKREQAELAKAAKVEAVKRKRNEIDYSTSTNMARFMFCKECGKYVRREEAHTSVFCTEKCQQDSNRRTQHFSNKSSWEMRV